MTSQQSDSHEPFDIVVRPVNLLDGILGKRTSLFLCKHHVFAVPIAIAALGVIIDLLHEVTPVRPSGIDLVDSLCRDELAAVWTAKFLNFLNRNVETHRRFLLHRRNPRL